MIGTNAPSKLAHYSRVAAVVCSLCVSANLLTWIGLPYVCEGGSPFLKIHPASLLCVLAFVMEPPRLVVSHLAPPPRAWRTSLPALYVICLCVCLASELLLTGIGNAIVILDTFLPGGLLAIALMQMDETQRLQLQAVLRAGLLINAILAVGEGFCHATLIPISPSAANGLSLRNDFRPFALYDHPLTGAAATMIGLLLPPGGRWGAARTILYFALLSLGLLAFGERSAIGVTAIIATAASLPSLLRYVLRRHDLHRGTLVCFGAVLVVSAFCLSAYAAGLGGRLNDHLYWDASARVRLRQWDVLGMLDTQQLLFGTPRQGALALLEPMRIRFGVPVIENSWLLMFMSLGLFGFPFLILGFGAFLLWCAKRGRGRGFAMTIGLLAMASSSNALGRKSILLIVFAGAVSSLPECRECNPDPSARAH